MAIGKLYRLLEVIIFCELRLIAILLTCIKEYSMERNAILLMKMNFYGLICLDINILVKPSDCHLILSLLKIQEVREVNISIFWY
jgi:hypothetical protein